MCDQWLSNGQLPPDEHLKQNSLLDTPCNSDESQRSISELECAIETKTRERNELREKLRQITRATERLESVWSSKLELKERELRLFLHSPTARTSTSEVDTPKGPTSENSATVNTTVRSVPALVGSSKKPVDSLLGPATFPVSHSAPTNGLLPTPTVGITQTTDSISHSSTSRQGTSVKSVSDPYQANSSYRDVLVDPSVDLVLSRFRRTQRSFEELITANQTDLQSFTFTQNSQNGKRMMMRIRVLEQENEELANMNRTGPISRLDTEIALRRAFVDDLKQAHSDMEYLIEETESETELLGSTLLMLQQRLQFAHNTAKILATELEKLEPHICKPSTSLTGWSPMGQTTDNNETLRIDYSLNQTDNLCGTDLSDVAPVTDISSLSNTSSAECQDQSDSHHLEINSKPLEVGIISAPNDIDNKPVTLGKRRSSPKKSTSPSDECSNATHQHSEMSLDTPEPLLKKIRDEYTSANHNLSISNSKKVTERPIIPTQITKKRLMLTRRSTRQNPVEESLERTSSFNDSTTTMTTVLSSSDGSGA